MAEIPEEALFEAGRLKRRFTEAVGALHTLYGNGWQNFKTAPLKKKLLYGASALTVCGAFYGMGDTFGATPLAIQTLGLAGYLLSFSAKRLEHNRHRLAIAACSGAIIAGHKLMLGAWSYAAMGAIASTRAATMSMMPDNKQAEGARLKVGLSFAAVGAASITAISAWDNSWFSMLNIIAMGCGTTADILTSNEKTRREALQERERNAGLTPRESVLRMIEDGKRNDSTLYARITPIIANGCNALYGVLLFYNTDRGSLPGVVFDTAAVENARQAICRHDFPKYDQKGNNLPLRERWRQYAGLVLHRRPPEGLSPTDADKLAHATRSQQPS